MWPATRLAPVSQMPGSRARRQSSRLAIITTAVLLAVLAFLPERAPGQTALPHSEPRKGAGSISGDEFPDFPESVWADTLAPATGEKSTPRRSGDAMKKSPGGGLSRIRGVEDIPEMSTAERINEIAMQATTALFFFVIGACVGSFLNVVVYRLPRGLSLWGRKSHCPRCQFELSFRENMPIVGWLRLGGRCLACRAPISIRYPSVEVITGLIFLVLLQVELLSGGKSIPIRTPNYYAGAVWIIWYPKWDLIALYAYHCFLMCTLLCVALIRKDGQSVPGTLLAVAAVVGVAAPMAMPSLHPVPAIVPPPHWFFAGESRCGEMVTAVSGLAAGVLLGGLLLLTAQRGTSKAHWGGLPVSLGLAGLYLGWQAAVLIALMAAAAQFLHVVAISLFHVPAPDDSRLASTFAAVATFVQITFWRPASALIFGPSHTEGLGAIGLCILLIALLGIFTRFLQSRSPTEISARSTELSMDELTST